MNDQEFDLLISSARLHDEHSISPFTQQVMGRIGQRKQFLTVGAKKTFWDIFRYHYRLALVLLVLVASLSFTGYSYAIGSNPISLLRRWITGDTVHVQYQGRTFEHGKSLSYSDAAVTAYAELNTVESLHFKADNDFQIPEDGIERVSPAYATYSYPWIGTVKSTDGVNVVIQKQYTIGDKTHPSRDEDSVLTLPVSEVSPFINGEHASITNVFIGKLVVVYENSYLKYRIGSHSSAEPDTHYFAFQLSRPLQDYKAATAPTPVVGYDNAKDAGIYEPTWGGGSNRCSNNAADTCDPDKQGASDGQSLFPNNANNFSVVRYGESDPDHSGSGLILRNLQGKITNITTEYMSVKTSSGAVWQLAYTAEQQKQFTKNGLNPLQVNNVIVASVVATTSDLDNRTFDTSHIYAMQRY